MWGLKNERRPHKAEGRNVGDINKSKNNKYEPYPNG